MTTPDPAGWRDRLQGASVGVPRRDAQPLGLLFQLRRLTRAGSQWTAPRAKPAGADRGDSSTLRLGVRPTTLSDRGNWVTSELGWGSLGYRVERSGLDPAQVRWFGQFAALHRASSDGYAAHEADWLYLDELASPLLWPLLREAAGLGIRFVSGKRGETVRLVDGGAVSVEISAPDAAGGGLRLRRLLRLPDTDDTTPVTGAIGDHGVYSVTGPAEPEIALVAVPSGGVGALGGATLDVPAHDVAEFWREFHPVLADRVRIESPDLDLPEHGEEPVLVVVHGPGDRVAATWEGRRGRAHRVLPETDAPFPVPDVLRDADAAAFLAEDVPAFREAGFRVEVHGDPPAYREQTDVPRLQLTAVPSEKRDWLELGFTVTVGGREVAFADVFKALSRGRAKLLLPDKTYLSLMLPVFDPLKLLIEESEALGEWETGKPLVPRFRADLLEPFEDRWAEQPDAVAWRRAAAGLTTAPAPIDPPAALAAELRPYQLEGFRFMAHLADHDLGGVLADDMGLGKTLQAVALLLHATDPDVRGQRRPDAEAPRRHLVVAPTSVVDVWVAELARWAPALRVHAVRGIKGRIPTDVDVVVTSYGVLRQHDRLFRTAWDVLVVDEAQTLKNPATQAHERVRLLDRRRTFALTGTPLENGLLDLWSVLRIAAPGLFPSRIEFDNRYVKVQKQERLAELRARIRPLFLRRTKEQVAPELPERQEQQLGVDLSSEHRAQYERWLQRERQRLLDLVDDDLDRNRFTILRSLTLLRLMALDPSLVEGADVEPVANAKLDAVTELLDEVVAGGHRALVFSQFTSFLALARERFEQAGIATEYLDGTTLRRDEVVRRFREGDAPVFCISLRAGGVGLTLTEADYVILLDPWWNPAVEQQAVDRAHRIGQTKPVVVYRVVANDTIEEKVLALSREKRKLFDRLVDDGEPFSGPLNADDVRALLR